MLSYWLSLKRLMKKEAVWSRLQLVNRNLTKKCGWQNWSGYSVCSAGQLRGMALAGRNAPGSSCVCSRAPAAYSEVHVAMAPLAASSSVSFLGVCGLIAAQPCCLQTWESRSARMGWGHSCCSNNYAVSGLIGESLCASLQLLFLEILLNAAYGTVSPVNCKISSPTARPAAKIHLLLLVSQIVTILNQALSLK